MKKNDYIQVDREVVKKMSEDIQAYLVENNLVRVKTKDMMPFLIEKGYIWFDSRNDKEYYKTFGAGTRIERRRNYRIDNYLQDELY